MWAKPFLSSHPASAKPQAACEDKTLYKLLLCWRYLRTRYLALVCIVSVMLGVGTLIVVNSIMGGFSSKLRERLHGLLSDIVIEAYDYNGFGSPDRKIKLIQGDPILEG